MFDDERTSMDAIIHFFISLANAYVSGMREDLDLESVAYNWADTIMSISLNVYVKSPHG